LFVRLFLVFLFNWDLLCDHPTVTFGEPTRITTEPEVLIRSLNTETRSGRVLVNMMANTTTTTTIATNTAPTPSADSSRLLLDRFTGNDRVVKVDLWVNLFELVVAGKPDNERLMTLMRYLSGEALNWFATDVAADIGHLTWNEAKARLIARFGTPTIHPMIEAQKRILSRADTVQSYYDAKMRLIRLARLSDDVAIAMLTDGMPGYYKPALISANITTPIVWLTKALQLEAVYRRPQVFADRRQPQAVVHYADNTARPDNQRQPRREAKKPPAPCRFCTERGQTSWHWHRDCPNRRRPVTPQAAEDSADANQQPQALSLEAAVGQHTADHLNWLGGRL
jgi:hypothetical protein